MNFLMFRWLCCSPTGPFFLPQRPHRRHGNRAPLGLLRTNTVGWGFGVLRVETAPHPVVGLQAWQEVGGVEMHETERTTLGLGRRLKARFQWRGRKDKHP